MNAVAYAEVYSGWKGLSSRFTVGLGKMKLAGGGGSGFQ